MSRMLEHTARIRQRATAARQAADNTTLTLLDEIADKLADEF